MKIILRKAACALLALALLVCGAATASATSRSEALGHSNYFLLQEIIDLYLETSLYETDRETLVDNMLYNYLLNNPMMIGALANALLSTNDPYSAYYAAQDSILRTTSYSYGILVVDSDSFEVDDTRRSRPGVYITEVIDGSNAQFAGLLPGDRFVSLDGVNVEGLTVSGIKYLLNAMPFASKIPEESPLYKEFAAPDYNAERFMEFSLLSWDFTKEITMVLERLDENGQPMLVTLCVAKGNAVTKDVTFSIDKESSTAAVSVTGFNSMAAAEQFEKALDEIYAQGCKNIILDLRDNPGGQAEAALQMASFFIEEGKPLYYTRTRTEPELIMTAALGGKKYDAGVFDEFLILVNENTASAAELLAYILRSQLDAKLIGKTTFGKALGQTAYQTVSGDSFTITTLEILTLEKTSYNGLGLEPDIYVPDITEKYAFPTGLSHFNHENYVTILPGEQNDAVLALEQRFGILGLLRTEKIDGICDDATGACTMIYKYVTLRDKHPTAEVTFDMVTKMTATINGYKDMNVPVNTQMNVATLYIENNSRGKRLAKEYVTAFEKYEKELKEQQEAAKKEYEEEMKKEQEKEVSSETGTPEESVPAVQTPEETVPAVQPTEKTAPAVQPTEKAEPSQESASGPQGE